MQRNYQVMKIVPAVVVVCMSIAAIAAPAIARKISQKDKMFSVSEISVKVGETVEFVNNDTVAHNVFSSTPGNEFNVKTQPPGASSPVTFDHEGTVEVRCAIHPKMKMKITVEK